MKKIISLVLLLVTQHVFAWDQKAPLSIDKCAIHAPYGMPTVNKPDATVICRSGYLTMHDNQAKIPVWASYRSEEHTSELQSH